MNSTEYARACFFDASALVKLYVNEPCSEVVRSFFSSEATKFTTQFCFYETLNMLKSKWLHGNALTKEQYLNASFSFVAWYSFMRRTTGDLDLTDPRILTKAQNLVRQTDLDISDALQILSVSLGDFSSFCEDSQTIFVTADKRLARVARDEGLRVWSVYEESAPC